MRRRHDTFCKLNPKTEETSLRNWEKWQRKWQTTQDAITERLNTPPGNLVMNYHEDLVRVNKEKELIEYARIPTKFDKYRGTPDFYKLPDALPEIQKCLCCGKGRGPTYFAVKTKQQRFIVPGVTMTGSPDHIYKEKNILNGTRNIYKKWQRSSYRQQQMQKWSKEIQNIVPHFPKFKNLVVVGKSLAPLEEDEESVHSDVEIKEEGEEKPDSSETPGENQRLSLNLNDLTLEQNAREGTTKLRVFFEYDISSKTMCSNTLAIENTSTATLRVKWKKIEKFRLFPENSRHDFDNYCFYFNKTDLVILPGQKVELPVWFQAEEPGQFSECWEVITVPKLWGEHFHVILFLESYAYYKNLKSSVDAIIRYIDTEAKNCLIGDIVHELIDQVKYGETPSKVCVYGEPQLFELANFLNERPQFLFNQVLVEELKQFYDKIKVNEEKWNFCIDKLRKLAHKKDVELYGENKLGELIEMQLRKKSDKFEHGHAEKAKPKKKKHKGTSKATKKKTDEKPPSVISKEPYEYLNQHKLASILRNFDAPVIHNCEREKYFACFQVFGAHLNKMCKQLETLEKENNFLMETVIPSPRYELIPISEQPDRLIYEYFEHHYIPVERFESFYPFRAKRKPKMLQDISETDVETLYTTYFDKSLSSQKKGGRREKTKSSKSKSKSPKEKSKSPKEKSKSPKGKSKSPKEKSKSPKGKSKKGKKDMKNEDSVQSFDPYLETFVYIQPEKMSTSERPASVQKPEDYKYKQYLVVYSCLSSAVDAVVDTLHSFECVASYPVVDVINSHFPTTEK